GEFASSIQGELNKLKSIPPWNVATQGDRPPKTYDAQINELVTALRTADANVKNTTAQKEEELRKAAEQIQALQAQVKTMTAARDKANADVVGEQNRRNERDEANSAKVKQLSEELAKTKLDMQNQEV